jgi:nucleotide-binding universal stress UspA family protein
MKWGMSEHTQTPFRVVVGFDFSEQASMALERAVWLMSGFADAEIHVVAALDWRHHDKRAPSVSSDFEGSEDLRVRTHREAERLLEEFRPPSVRLFIHTRIGNAADAILSVAVEVHADLIFVGTHSKKGVERMFVGSVSERVVREASCPVMVIRQTSYDREAVAIGPEPACPSCLKTRAETGGQNWWCEYHDHAPPYESPLTSAHRNDPEVSGRRFSWPYSR